MRPAGPAPMIATRMVMLSVENVSRRQGSIKMKELYLEVMYDILDIQGFNGAHTYVNPPISISPYTC